MSFWFERQGTLDHARCPAYWVTFCLFPDPPESLLDAMEGRAAGSQVRVIIRVARLALATILGLSLLACGTDLLAQAEPPGPDWEELPEARHIYNSARPEVMADLYVHREKRTLHLHLHEGERTLARLVPDGPQIFIYPEGLFVQAEKGRERGIFPVPDPASEPEFSPLPELDYIAYYSHDGRLLRKAEVRVFDFVSPRGHGFLTGEKLQCYGPTGEKAWEFQMTGTVCRPPRSCAVIQLPPPGRHVAIISDSTMLLEREVTSQDRDHAKIHIRILNLGDGAVKSTIEEARGSEVVWASEREILVAGSPGGWMHSITRYTVGPPPVATTSFEAIGFPLDAWVSQDDPDRVVFFTGGPLEYYVGGSKRAEFQLTWTSARPLWEASRPTAQLRGLEGETARLQLGDEVFEVDFGKNPPEQRKVR